MECVVCSSPTKAAVRPQGFLVAVLVESLEAVVPGGKNVDTSQLQDCLVYIQLTEEFTA